MTEHRAAAALLSGLLLAACGAGDASRGAAAPTGAREFSGARVPPGFHVGLFAEGIPGVRFLALDPEGRVTASVPNEDRVIVLPDEDGDGRADRTIVFAEGIPAAHGVVWHDGTLYVAGTGGLWRLRDSDGDLHADEKTRISDDLPGGSGHFTRTVVVGPGTDGRPVLYVSAGSSCNICIETDPRRAAIQRFPLSGGDGEVIATGLRNAVGMAFRPGTRELWATENGRDWLGDDLPPDELNRIEPGGFYGWPYFYGKNVRDPKFDTVPERLRSPLPSAVDFPAHSAPLGIAFYDGKMFPADYRGDAFVAFHGSWNRSLPTGYKVVRVVFRDGRPVRTEDFLTGFLRTEPEVEKTGRPVCPLVAPDGALLVSDDAFGRIYRITYTAS